MNPISASRVRFAIRAMDAPTLAAIAEGALASDSGQGVSALLDERLEQPLGAILAGQAATIDAA